MCWSLEVSLFTVVLVYSTFFYLLYRRASPRDKWNAIFLIIFGNMQTIDLILWYFAKHEDLSQCSFHNRIITRIGFYIIVLEPFASLLGRYSYGIKPSKLELFAYLMACVVGPTLSRSFFLFPDCEMFYCARITNDQHLLLGIGLHKDGSNNCWREQFIWGNYTNEIPLILRLGFLFTIAYPYLFMKPFFNGMIQICILTITWMFGFFSDSHASIWCFANVFQVITMILDPYIIPKKTEYPPIKRTKYDSILMDRYTSASVPKNLDAIVIGSGIGGLTSAVLLAKTNKKVLVLEQHYRAGGCTHTFDEFGGFFDSGIHYVGSKGIIDTLLSYSCINPPEFRIMGNKDDGYLYDRFELEPGYWIEYRKGWDAIEKELIAKFPHEINGIKELKKLREKASRITNFMVFIKLLNRFLPTFIQNILLEELESHLSPTAETVINSLFKEPKLRALISGGQLIDWNLQPNKVSWWVVISMMNYYINGGYYPMGGSHRMAEGMIPIIERAGGRVLCREPVARILLDEKTGKAIGVQLRNNDKIYAPLIISDAGVANTRLLLQEEKKPLDEILPNLPASNGHMTAFVTLDKNFRELEICAANIHSMPDLPKYGYDLSKMQEDFYQNPMKQPGCLVTITCPSAKDAIYDEKYPNECNVLMLTEAKMSWFDFPCGTHGNRTEKYKEFKAYFQQLFLERLYNVFPKTKGHVKKIEIGTPVTTKFYLYAPDGESYGLELSPKRFSKEVMKKLEAKTQVDGLFLTGEAAFFGGLAGAMVSGWITTFHVLGVRGMLKLLGWIQKEDAQTGEEKNNKKDKKA